MLEFFDPIMASFAHFVDVMLHLNRYMAAWTQEYGSWIYLIVFLIVFAETGLIVTPFLPGDSLLFALGALTALGEGGLSIGLLSLLLFVAAFLGDNVNYSVGKYAGKSWIPKLGPKIIKPQYLEQTELFFQKYGPSAIVLARFAPILRTYVPFVAGLGKMDGKIFLLYNFVGALLWTQIFLWAGRFFGQMPAVQKNFSLITVGIILLSIAPIAIPFIKSRWLKKRSA